MRSMFAVLAAVATMLGAFLAAPVAQENSGAATGRPQVVLLHGLARSPVHMAPLAQALREAGYEVHNIGYPSTRLGIGELTPLIQAEIDKRVDPGRPVHYIGYSMGGIMVRALLKHHRPENLSRVVQLAAPNGGSEVADVLEDFWLYEAIFGPAGKELVTDSALLDNLLGTVNYELGVVAGDVSIDPVSSAIIIGPDDGKVSVESTRVPGMQDHIVVPASHTFFPANDEVHRQTLHFLAHGFFAR